MGAGSSPPVVFDGEDFVIHPGMLRTPRARTQAIRIAVVLGVMGLFSTFAKIPLSRQLRAAGAVAGAVVGTMTALGLVSKRATSYLAGFFVPITMRQVDVAYERVREELLKGPVQDLGEATAPTQAGNV